jgi:hypothetical protein
MKMMQVGIALILAIAIVSCQTTEIPSKNEKLKGLWSLYIMEKQDSAGKWTEWRDGMQGYVLYDGDGNMALHLTDKDYQKTDLHFPNFTDTISLEALKHLTKSYVYLAKYVLDDSASIVTHHRISHSNPQEWNGIVKRRVSFIGDTLVLAPVEKKNASLRLKWIKY